MAEPNTRFMTSYLGAVGALAQVAGDLDLELAFQRSSCAERTTPTRAPRSRRRRRCSCARSRGCSRTRTCSAGSSGRYDGELWKSDGTKARFAANPIELLERLYHFLDLEPRADKPPAEQIWDARRGDPRRRASRSTPRSRRAPARATSTRWRGSSRASPWPPSRAATSALWSRCVAAHRGFQLGLELLLLVPRVGARSGFLDVRVDDDLTVVFPERFADETRAAELARALAPPPPAAFDEIVTPMGGTFYAREAPHLPPLIEEGQHFEAGQPLFVIEVMKMFNKVLGSASRAP